MITTFGSERDSNENVISVSVVDNRTEIIALFEKTVKELNDTASMRDSVKLEAFAPWLQQYHWLLGGECIELPGQYTGESRPNIRTNIKIVRFDAKVKMFRSLRRPIKVSVLGSDGKTYDFLVKYGEDLRQDQCIQQMQRLFTDQLANDKNCRSHNLSIETYKVIPISPICGLLSWVEDTQSIGQLVDDVDKDDLVRDHHKFLDKAPNRRSNRAQMFERYGEAVSSYSPQAVSILFYVMTRVPFLSYFFFPNILIILRLPTVSRRSLRKSPPILCGMRCTQ